MAASGRAGATLALALLLIPFAARAQVPAAALARSAITIELGIAHASVLDPVASPMRYSGAGAAAAVTYRRGTASGALELGLDLQANRLESGLSGAAEGPHENSGFAAVTARALRRVVGARGAAPGTALLLGAEARLDAAVRDHFYSQPALDFGYGLALAALGPAARLRVARGGGGELRVDVAAPLVGIALRPYGDLAFAQSELHPHAAAPPSLAGLGAGLACAVPLGAGRSRLVVVWRLDWLRYRDADLYHAARQRLGAGIELPLGGRS